MMKYMLVTTVTLLLISGPLAANEVDRNFVDAMILHHQDGIEMAEMAIRKAESSELRRLAQKMADEQRRDIEQLRSMRDESLDPNRPELGGLPGMTGMNMKWLESKSGREFDRVFAIAMIDHHMGGIKLAEHDLSRGSVTTVKSKAREIRTKQRRDMRDLARHK